MTDDEAAFSQYLRPARYGWGFLAFGLFLLAILVWDDPPPGTIDELADGEAQIGIVRAVERVHYDADLDATFAMFEGCDAEARGVAFALVGDARPLLAQKRAWLVEDDVDVDAPAPPSPWSEECPAGVRTFPEVVGVYYPTPMLIAYGIAIGTAVQGLALLLGADWGSVVVPAAGAAGGWLGAKEAAFGPWAILVLVLVTVASAVVARRGRIHVFGGALVAYVAMALMARAFGPLP